MFGPASAGSSLPTIGAMPPHPLVSIVVPTRGGATHLPVLLDALSRQSDSNWEAVVVVDGDVDGSEQVIQRAAVDLPVRAVVFPENRGRSAALNAGFETASGDVLVRCDDDMVPGPDYVRHHAAAHEGRDVGVVGLVRNTYPETAYARVYGRDWDERYRRDAYRADASETWHYWAGNCSITRRLWSRVGPYDTTFRSYGWEDVDWGYRLARAGIPVVLEPRLETEHRGPAPTAAARAQRAFYAGAAKRLFDDKHGIEPVIVPPRSAWDRAVLGVERTLDEQRIAKMGPVVDRAAAVLPRPVARKAVALLVEASAAAGRRSVAGDAI